MLHRPRLQSGRRVKPHSATVTLTPHAPPDNQALQVNPAMLELLASLATLDNLACLETIIQSP